MNIFIDTEFTDFDSPSELISIGLVSEDGRQFYGERNDYSVDRCSAFVKSTVLPQLGQKADSVFTKSELAQKVNGWLLQFADETPVLCYDLARDITLLRDLIGDLPAWLATRDIRNQIDQAKFTWYIENCASGRQHHALYDSLANKFGFTPAS
ncbi:MAG: 3'-5' exoribonuclease [Burkholderiales bacterium]|nr:3'-5' exoribonuclease [Burkholderiales bacterium]